jgi:plasmid maintenance system antidote protein VapI
MNIAHNIKEFLNTKFKQLKLKRQHFIAHSGIDAPTVSKLCNARQLCPSMINVIKIANFFKCPIDEVIGRKKYLHLISKDMTFYDISSEQITNNLKNFITQKLRDTNLSVYSLEKLCGIGSNTLLSFIDTTQTERGLKITTIILLADYFHTTVDSIIGRVNNTNT